MGFRPFRPDFRWFSKGFRGFSMVLAPFSRVLHGFSSDVLLFFGGTPWMFIHLLAFRGF